MTNVAVRRSGRMASKEPPHRHTLTPIGDEVDFRSHPLEVGKPSFLDRLRRLHHPAPPPATLEDRLLDGVRRLGIAVLLTSAAAIGLGLIVQHAARWSNAYPVG